MNSGTSFADEFCNRRVRLCRLEKLHQRASSIQSSADPVARAKLWKARKALYPTLYRFDPRKKPIIVARS